jgi:hypothetical protein
MSHRVIYKEKPKEDILKSLVKEFFGQNPECNVATVSIKKDKPKRSDAQNRIYWYFIDIIAKEVGYSKQEMHLTLANKFLKKIEFTTQDGEFISQIPSTRDLSISDFVDYLWDIESLASEYGISLPYNSDFNLAVYGK